MLAVCSLSVHLFLLLLVALCLLSVCLLLSFCLSVASFLIIGCLVFDCFLIALRLLVSCSLLCFCLLLPLLSWLFVFVLVVDSLVAFVRACFVWRLAWFVLAFFFRVAFSYLSCFQIDFRDTF